VRCNVAVYGAELAFVGHGEEIAVCRWRGAWCGEAGGLVFTREDRQFRTATLLLTLIIVEGGECKHLYCDCG